MHMDIPVKIAGISGSLRKGSFNTQLLNASKQFFPANTEIEILSIADLPLYNADEDLPSASQRPDTVTKFREAIARADALLIVSPEYNHSIPGGLKNAIDWASRGKDSPLLNKPVALMGATPGLWGTVRMQQAFLPVFHTLKMQLVYGPEILLAKADTKFDGAGNLTDEKAKELITKKLAALIAVVLANRKLSVQ